MRQDVARRNKEEEEECKVSNASAGQAKKQSLPGNICFANDAILAKGVFNLQTEPTSVTIINDLRKIQRWLQETANLSSVTCISKCKFTRSEIY